MRIALFITCLDDALFPDVGQATVAAAASGSATRSTSRPRRPAAARCTSTPATRRGAAAGAAASSTSSTPYDAVVAPSGRASARSATSTRWSPSGSATPGLAAAVEAVAGRDLRAVRVPGRRARRDRRRRLLPAPGDLPPDLPLAADARASATSRCGCCARSTGIDLVELPDGRRVLRVRRHVRGQERRHLDGDAGRQDAPRARHRRRGLHRRRQLLPDAHRRRPVPAASRRPARAPRRDPGLDRGAPAAMTRDLSRHAADRAARSRHLRGDAPFPEAARRRSPTRSCAATSATRPRRSAPSAPRVVGEVADWEELRDGRRGDQGRRHAPTSPAPARAARGSGHRRAAARVHWARDAAEANAIVARPRPGRRRRRGRQGQVDGHPGDRAQRGPRGRRASPPARPTSPS